MVEEYRTIREVSHGMSGLRGELRVYVGVAGAVAATVLTAFWFMFGKVDTVENSTSSMQTSMATLAENVAKMTSRLDSMDASLKQIVQNTASLEPDEEDGKGDRRFAQIASSALRDRRSLEDLVSGPPEQLALASAFRDLSEDDKKSDLTLSTDPKVIRENFSKLGFNIIEVGVEPAKLEDALEKLLKNADARDIARMTTLCKLLVRTGNKADEQTYAACEKLISKA